MKRWERDAKILAIIVWGVPTFIFIGIPILLATTAPIFKWIYAGILGVILSSVFIGIISKILSHFKNN